MHVETVQTSTKLRYAPLAWIMLQRHVNNV